MNPCRPLRENGLGREPGKEGDRAMSSEHDDDLDPGLRAAFGEGDSVLERLEQTSGIVPRILLDDPVTVLTDVVGTTFGSEGIGSIHYLADGPVVVHASVVVSLMPSDPWMVLISALPPQ